ncbi:probable cytochrome P450 28d2 [Condylostylus longicornis]|uniref:probable cytochrome P450 28d2 n=1 Tax=Condylostylus longicornis TaxID=2530218 RepID=UPI00244E036B|nr:probable cytochrome P450 28d2 [Condylostylus longicornis]
MELPFFLSTLILLGLAILLGYVYLVWNFNYWKKRGINGPEPKLFIGTLPKSTQGGLNLAYDFVDIYRKYKPTEKFVGIFSFREPELLLISPELIRDVLTTNFKSFHDNQISSWVHHDVDKVAGNNPFSLYGEEWKNMRSILSPALTINRLKISYPVSQETCFKMNNFLRNLQENRNSSKSICVDGKLLALRFTGELITDLIFGLEANAFDLDISKNSIMTSGWNCMINDFKNGFGKFAIFSRIPYLSRILNVRLFSNSTEKFFLKLLNDAIELRLKNPNNRTDFLNFMLSLQERNNFSTEQLLSYALTFGLDGYETTATLFSHTLLMLGRNKIVQEKLRNEIMDLIDEKGTLDFNEIAEMKYLDLCVHETLRIISPILYSFKKCTQPFTFTNSENGKTIEILPGQTVILPFHSLHHDREYYPNPEEFIPERFSEENGGIKKFRDEGKFFPFGDGPRICLGMKFGLIQSKIGICEILRHFKITVNERTRHNNTLATDSLFAMLDGGIWLDFEEIYWRKRGVNGPKPKPFIGTFPKTMLKNSNLIYDQTDLYREFKSTDKVIGVYTIREPELMILCPNLVRDIFVKYFKNFHDNAVGKWIKSWYTITQEACNKLSDYIIAANNKNSSSINARNLALRLENSNYRNDFLDTLIQLKENKNLTLDELVAHALTLTLDGYDTTATTISHCLLLLGRNKNAQNKLRTEIFNNLDENQCLSFEILNDMKYLDQCINETLRIFPPIAFSLKRCTETLTLENYNGNKIVINDGQTIHLPLYSIYHDPDYYYNPEEFIPERFDEKFGGVKKFKEDGKFFPFGDGPRICPGMKFGLCQSKAAIAEIVKRFSIDVDEKTRQDNLIGSISLAF